MDSKTDKKRPSRLQEPKAVKQAAFPVWAPLLIIIAVILTGVILGVEGDAVPKAYFVIFAIAAIAVTILVEVRGLFLTVASLPIYFVLGTVIIGWLTTPNSTVQSSRAFIINSLYPSISHFLWLLFPFLACIVIAVLRWWIYREDLARQAAYQEHVRRRRAHAERNNRDTYAQVRSSHVARSSRVDMKNEPEDYFELDDEDRYYRP